MIKTTVRLLIWSAILCSGFASDWRTEVAAFFAVQADYGEAARYLDGQLSSLNDEDKPVALGLLAFLSNRLGDKESEYRLLGEYFEKYGPLDMAYHFLPLSAQNAVIIYFREWILKYPWVLRVGFVESSMPQARPAASSPPAKLVLGLEMANEAYYKLFENTTVLEGGQFRRGHNSVSLDTSKLFRDSGAHTYVLELKAGDLIVRRKVTVDVRLNAFGVVGNKAPPSGKIPTYVLKLFLGDDLLAFSRKSPPATPPIKIEMPQPTGVYDPWGPGYQNKPEIPNTFPILGIPALINEIIKSLKKKDEVEPVPPVELKTEITLVFKGKQEGSRETEIIARLRLDQREIEFFPYSSARNPDRSPTP
ncbi:MAG: hypothetical protein QHH14_00255 [Clostridiales bacterium]|nr:hypothetical protein [Clostridiales bacterium]